MNRRLMPALLTCVLLTGCAVGSGAAGPGAGRGDRGQTGPATAQRLTIALAKDSGPLNIFADQSPAIDELVYDKLLAPSPYVDQPRPWLATAVRQLDPSTWEADLRADVRWQDGERFDADDVAFSFDYFKKAPTGTYTHHVSDVPTIETITALSPTKVRFVCAFPCPELGTVTLADLPVIAEHIWAGVPPDKAKQVTSLPVGTGPYRLVSYDSAAGYRFEANPDYFAGAPVVQELVMPVISDASATFTALRSGEVDATTRPLPPELIDPFTSSNDVGVVKTAPLRFPELRVNYDRAPFDQPAFRAALSRASTGTSWWRLSGSARVGRLSRAIRIRTRRSRTPRCRRRTSLSRPARCWTSWVWSIGTATGRGRVRPGRWRSRSSRMAQRRRMFAPPS